MSKHSSIDYYFCSEEAADIFIGVLIFKLFVALTVGAIVLMAKGVKKLFRWLNDTADKLAAKEAAKKIEGTVNEEIQ